MYKIPQSEMDRVRKEIIKDIGESVLVEIKRKIKKRAYDTGRLMRSTELELTDKGFNIGSHEQYSLIMDTRRRLFNPDKYTDRGVENAMRG
ncbi:MAG: hypothetical protein KOO65_08560 [Desulfobacterales bacterium]|nr:hypothetical protein [Desulfobacterales bacterium]